MLINKQGLKTWCQSLSYRAFLESCFWAAATGIVWYNVSTYITQDMTATLQHTRAFQQGTNYVNQTKKHMAWQGLSDSGTQFDRVYAQPKKTYNRLITAAIARLSSCLSWYAGRCDIRHAGWVTQDRVNAHRDLCNKIVSCLSEKVEYAGTDRLWISPRGKMGWGIYPFIPEQQTAQWETIMLMQHPYVDSICSSTGYTSRCNMCTIEGPRRTVYWLVLVWYSHHDHSRSL